MLLRRLLPVLLLASCSRGAEADLQYIKEARSIGGEWALVNEQASKGQLTEAYVRSMHRWLRQNLQTSSTSLTQPNSAYGKEIRTLLADPDDADPREIRTHVERLKQIEDALESA